MPKIDPPYLLLTVEKKLKNCEMKFGSWTYDGGKVWFYFKENIF